MLPPGNDDPGAHVFIETHTSAQTLAFDPDGLIARCLCAGVGGCGRFAAAVDDSLPELCHSSQVICGGVVAARDDGPEAEVVVKVDEDLLLAIGAIGKVGTERIQVNCRRFSRPPLPLYETAVPPFRFVVLVCTSRQILQHEAVAFVKADEALVATDAPGPIGLG